MGNKFIWILMAMLSIIGGVLALMNPVFASGLATIIVAWMFIIFGALQVIAGFRVEGAGAKIWTILLGALAVYLGITILGHPLKGMIALTSMIAILCLGGGAAKVVLSFAMEDRRFFWLVLISGIASLAVGVIIFMNWPVSAVSALGILLGVQLLSDGVSSLAMAFSRDGDAAAAA
ncbi:MAG: HdeD family acid-resistance protein [Paracoccaceae bacterium]